MNIEDLIDDIANTKILLDDKRYLHIRMGNYKEDTYEGTINGVWFKFENKKHMLQYLGAFFTKASTL